MPKENGRALEAYLLRNDIARVKLHKHALIVEDDSNTSSALDRVLKAMGFSTDIASTLKDARALITKTVPAVVLLDLALPDGNGLEFLLEMRDSHKTRFVIITGNQTQQAAVESLRAQADDFLVKPVSLSDLRNTITRSGEKAKIAEAGARTDDIETESSTVAPLDEKEIIDALVGKTFWRLEKDLLLATLDKQNGDKEETARILGISLKTLYNRLHAYS